MPTGREFLDWKQPALAGAAEYLHKRFGRAGQIDLGGVIVVVPGSRAGRRLLELLVERADQQGLALTPPTIVTENQLPELLYHPQFQFADHLTQQLAWAAALVSMPPRKIAPFLPHPPEKHDTPRWLALAETLRRLHTELAADGLECKHVLEGGDGVEGFAEHDRWRCLCEIQRAYLDTLDELKLWDVQTARLVAIDKREIATDKQIVLLGTVDLNRAHRRMLDQIADRVTALVVAPRELADRFDAYGCLIPEKWTEAELPLADQQIERVEGPADQADAVARWMASLGGRYRADQIVVGMGDERLAPQLERQLAQCGAAARWAIGKRLPETGPYRLLKVAADYASTRRFRDLAALVRHPDVFDWLVARLPRDGQPRDGQPRDLLTELDEYACERFPSRVDEERLKDDAEAATVQAVCQQVHELVAPLAGDERPLAQWGNGLRAVLAAVYGTRELDRDRPADRYVLRALEEISHAIDDLGNVPAELQPALDCRQAARLVLSSLAGANIAPPAQADAVELLGWLELPLDDAPALAVTTFNEGFVPSSSCADAFLPNRLRCKLGLLDNDRRLARDAYALSVLLASRRELKLIVARRDSEGNPLVASRLLFATDAEGVVRRARRFFAQQDAAPPRRRLLADAAQPRERTLLEPPRPQPLPQPLRKISVTQLRDYIACPYRFYLRHVLKLQPATDEAVELDGGTFGGLVHGVLEQFGRADRAREARESSDPRRIVEYLDFQLDRVATARYGKHARPAVRVQIEQARLRLLAFARWQAERTAAGWRIVFSEDSEDVKRTLSLPLEIDGQTLELRGRIDRIDYHEALGKLCVLDYKTSDAGDPPERTHRRGEEWIDLQLPLYRHLLRSPALGIRLPEAAVELGYIVLPKDTSAVGLALAEWDEALLKDADERAWEILRAILAGRFWPPTSPPPDFADDVAVICQDHRMGSWKLIQTLMQEGSP